MLKIAYRLGKILNIYTLGLFNLAIILFAEFFGNGVFFYKSNLIHLIGIIFPVFILIFLFSQYLIFDATLRKALSFFLGAFVLSGLIHTIIHILEIVKNLLAPESIRISMQMIYIISFLLIIIAAEIPWSVYTKKFHIGVLNYIALIAILFILTVFALVNINFSLLIKNSLASKVLVAMLVGFGLLAIYEIRKKIKYILPLIFGKFSNFIIAGIGVNIISGLFEFFALKNPLILGLIQNLYISHFLFYIGSSFLILAFVNLLNLPGMYQDIRALIEKEEFKP
ncbi:MAG: hypothetical protein HYV52_01330 [Parcubacteria group bacterium]|nr:hypothetical protein [Parcubacteria group bacterium]